MTVPLATYRLQFREGMDFDRAAALVPYLARLGVSHLYASPIFTAPGGSTHGYDVADHNEIDPSLGSRAGFDRLSAALKGVGLKLLLDIVPNHMAASLENPWWRSVVEWGAESPYARHFDIDWRERLTLPILGQPFADAVRAGEIGLTLDKEAGVLALSYFDQRLPLHPATYAAVLDELADPLAAALLAAVSSADPATEATHEHVRELLSDEAAAKPLQVGLDRLAADAAFLEALHERQPWHLLFWKEARRHLSYRRFFEVTGLAGVRVEDPAVFADVHRLTLDLVRAGQVDGLRIDHVDGLADPQGYLRHLRAEVGPDFYIVVEKILGEGEALPADWPIQGTTGYEFAAAMPELFVDPTGAEELTGRFATLAGGFDLEAERLKAKTLMVTRNFETELNGLAALASRALADAPSEDALRQAIVALITAFPVYRSYGNAGGLPEADRELLARVAGTARERTGETAALDAVLRLLHAGGEEAGANEFRARFQQLTGPATAKSVEDTLFYRANAVLGVNEVGGDPAQGVGSPVRFHAAMQAHAESQPHGLLATATHDTKRGEDARARLYALSEDADAWCQSVDRWRAMHEGQIQALPDGPAPEPETEWLLFQALAGIWPEDTPDAETLGALSERFETYVEKALREAKLRSGWDEPDEAYEGAVKAYAARLLAPENTAFHADFAHTLRPFTEEGLRNSLAQTLLKLTAPGVPDIYQGSEGWDFSLVDPDNRRPVDFVDLSTRLDGLGTGEAGPQDAKLALIAAGLKLRRELGDLFEKGTYRPLDVTGSDRTVAYLREHGGNAVLTVVSRLNLKDGEAQGEIRTGASAEWQCALSGRRFEGESLALADVLGGHPIALLRRLGD